VVSNMHRYHVGSHDCIPTTFIRVTFELHFSVILRRTLQCNLKVMQMKVVESPLSSF